jgi:hypothetical protein
MKQNEIQFAAKKVLVTHGKSYFKVQSTSNYSIPAKAVERAKGSLAVATSRQKNILLFAFRIHQTALGETFFFTQNLLLAAAARNFDGSGPRAVK